MLSLAQLRLKTFYDTTVEYISALSPVYPTAQRISAQSSAQRSPADSGHEDCSLASELAELRWRLEGAEAKATCTTKELESASRDVERYRSELPLLRERQRATEAALIEARNLLQQREIEIETLQNENSQLEISLSEMRRVAEERSSEVKSMEKFLSRTDRWAGAQVVQTVKDLNSEILQFSAAASESFTFESRSSEETQDRIQAIQRVESRLGPLIRQSLTNRDHSQDPTLLQIAIQASACQCVCRALSAFCIGLPDRLDSLLFKIHIHMHTTEPQATSSRWRALTHSHIRALTPNIDEFALKDISDAIIRGAANILVAAGYGDVDGQVEVLRTRFWTQVRHIAGTAYKIALVMREGTMSTDFQVVFVDHSRTFNPESMENAYAGYGPSRGQVLCTTDLGLRCYTSLSKDEVRKEDSVVEKLMILKPRVVLESVMEVLDSD